MQKWIFKNRLFNVVNLWLLDDNFIGEYNVFIDEIIMEKDRQTDVLFTYNKKY